MAGAARRFQNLRFAQSVCAAQKLSAHDYRMQNDNRCATSTQSCVTSVHLPKSTALLGVIRASHANFPTDNPALFIEFIVGMSIALIRSWSTKTAVRRIVEAIEAETLGTSFKRSQRGKPPH
jgi:hypothetical protein